MGDSVARVLAVYRRDAQDPPFETVRTQLHDAGVGELARQIELDADARRLLGRACAIDRWVDAIHREGSPVPAIDAAVTAVLDHESEGSAFTTQARAISHYGPVYAASVARVRLVRELLRTLDGPLSAGGPDADAPAAPARDVAPPRLEPPCDFGPAVSGHPHRFELLRRLGEGAQGYAYEAVDRRYSEGAYRHIVVVKVLPPALAGRAELELLRGGRVHHPSVVRWLDSGIDASGCGYVVSELVPGRTLEDPGVVESLGRRGAVEVIRHVARGVEAAHAAGVLHLDIKPGNVLVGTDGTARLCDFGAARPLSSASPVDETTPFFAAPEVLAGHPAGVAADIYALGSVLRWCMDALDEIGAAPLERDDSERLEIIWSRAMDPAPQRRHPAAREFAADLDAWLERRPLPSDAPSLPESLRLSIRRDPVTWGLAIASLISLVLVGWLWIASRLAESERHAERLAAEARKLRAEAFLGRYVDHLGEMARADGISAMPQVLAMQWLVGPQGIRDADLVERTRDAQRRAWMAIVDDADRTGTRDRLEPKLAALCLAMADLIASNPQRAHALLSVDLPWWRDHFEPDDPVRIAAEGLGTLAALEAAPGTALDDEGASRERLRAVQQLLASRDPALARRMQEAVERLPRRSRP